METGWQQALPTTQAARLATQRGPGPSPADRPGTLAGHGRGKQSQGLYFRHFLTDSFVFEKITRVHRAGGGPVEPRGARPDPDAYDDGRGRTANSGARRCERFLNQMQSRERDTINRRLCKFFFPQFLAFLEKTGLVGERQRLNRREAEAAWRGTARSPLPPNTGLSCHAASGQPTGTFPVQPAWGAPVRRRGALRDSGTAGRLAARVGWVGGPGALSCPPGVLMDFARTRPFPAPLGNLSQ